MAQERLTVAVEFDCFSDALRNLSRVFEALNTAPRHVRAALSRDTQDLCALPPSELYDIEDKPAGPGEPFGWFAVPCPELVELLRRAHRLGVI